MNSLVDRVSVEVSSSGEGYSVVFNNKSLWFANKHYATLYADRLSRDEDFVVDQMEHLLYHDWERCKPQTCQGMLWQLLRGLN